MKLHHYQRSLNRDIESTNAMFMRVQLARVIRKKRFSNGMLSLSLPESEIVFDDEGQVIELSLQRRALSGRLSTAIGKLTSLEAISVWGNGQLSGSLPASLGRLSNLKKLWLHECERCAHHRQALHSLSLHDK